MNWFTEGQKLKEQGLSYREIAEKVGVCYSTVQSRFRNLEKRSLLNPAKPAKSKSEKTKAVKVAVVKEVPVTTDSELQSLLLRDMRKGKTMQQLLLKKTADVTEARILKAIDTLKESTYIIDNLGGKYVLRTVVNMEQNHVETHWTGDRVIRFGVASDVHTSSKYQQLTHLNTFYDICAAEGIDTVYNPGDLVEGEYQTRRGHAYEIFNHSADDQVQYVIDNYPRRDGIVTKFITGNHDHTHLKNAGYDIGKRIHMERDDMEYLGINNATIMLTPNCRLDLSHPLDGSSYALSYSLQKSIEAMPVDDLPHIYIVGHHHKSIYLNTRGIHALEAGTFQAQSGWMKGKRLAAHVGGWIITVHVNANGNITRFIPEWIAFNKMIKNDF